MKRRSVMVFVLMMIGVLGAACSTNDSEGSHVILVEDGVEETQTAQTAWARENASATPGSTPTPAPTGTPYVIPTNEPEVDPETVIARVGNEEITLGQYQKYVRFERWFRLYQLARLVEKHGVEDILDLRKPENTVVSSLFTTLADSFSFGAQVERIMIIDAITLQEAIRRGLDVNPQQFDARLVQYLGMTVGQDAALPPGFDEAYDEFIRQMDIYTGLSEEEFRKIVRARTLYTQLEFLISHEPEAVPSTQEARVGMEVQDMIVPSMEDATTIAQRMRDGEALRDVALSLGYTPTSDDESRLLRWSDPDLSSEVLEAIFLADLGGVVGPIAIPQGWYVARVIREVYDVLSPQDIEALRKQYFLDWVEAKMDDPEYVVDYDNWIEYTPQEPLPQDVSPLLRDENVILPENSENPFGELFSLEGDDAESEAPVK